MAASQKHRACNRPRRPFWDKACNRIGDLATDPPCGKPIEDYSALHRGRRQGFVTEGPRQRFVTGGQPFQSPISRHCHMSYHQYGGWQGHVEDGHEAPDAVPINMSIYLSSYLSMFISLSLSL